VPFTHPPPEANKFNPLQGGARVGLTTLKVYDIHDSEIETLVQEENPVGKHEATRYAEGLPGGVYF